jgi:hypothetical protein
MKLRYSKIVTIFYLALLALAVALLVVWVLGELRD